MVAEYSGLESKTMSGYDEKSCSVLAKPHYRPIEAALRWCGLIEHETTILQKTGKEAVPPADAFPHWPCLRANAEKIFEATETGELTAYRDGRRVATIAPIQQTRKSLFPSTATSSTNRTEVISKERLTVKHSELKAWMTEHYPDQKPAFLFDETERTTHQAINAASFTALQADRDALRLQLDAATAELDTLRQNLATITSERDTLVANGAPVSQRSETTYLNTIGGLLGLMLGTSSTGAKHSVYKDQAAIISALLAHYPKTDGLSKSNLESKFAEAKRSLGAT